MHPARLTAILPYIAALCLLLTACQPTGIKQPLPGYDEVVYFFNDYPEADIPALYDNQSRSALDALKAAVISGDLPRSIADTSFIAAMTTLGYTQKHLDAGMFARLNNLFATQPGGVATTKQACTPVFRDILIFRKAGKIVAMAKLCFGCNTSLVTGTAYPAGVAPDRGFEQLRQLLRH